MFHLTHSILHIASHTLHLTCCILHIAFYTLHLTRYTHILNPGAGSPAAGAASSVAGWLLLLRSNCRSGSNPFSFVGLFVLVWVVVYYIILLLLKKIQEKSLELKGCRDVTIVLLKGGGENNIRYGCEIFCLF